MKKLIIIALTFTALTVTSVMAQDKEEPKLTKAQLSEAATTISEFAKNKENVKNYCKYIDLLGKADEALEKKDEKKAEEAGQEADKVLKALGEKFSAAMNTVGLADPEDKSNEALIKAVDDLDSNCEV